MSVEIGQANGPRPSNVRVSATAVGIIISSFTLVGIVFGFIGGYRLATTTVDQLTAWHAEDQTHFKELTTTIIADREALSARLQTLESDTKYTAQGIADLKALTRGTNR